MENENDSTSPNSTDNSTSIAPQPIEFGIWLYYINLAAMFLSTILLVIHTKKFFQTESSHTIIKMLTAYFCFIIYVGVQSNFTLFYPSCDRFFLITVSVFKIIAVVEIYRSFRKPSLNQQSTGRRPKSKYFTYFFLCLCIPILFAIFWYLVVVLFNERMFQNFSLQVIYFATLVFVFASFPYIKSPRTDEAEFALHKRLIFAILVYAVVLNFVQLNQLFGTLDFFFSSQNYFEQSEFIGSLSISLEAFLIGIFFTFRKDTFLPVRTDESIVVGH